MTDMSGGAPPTIQIPRWIQLVGLPILALIALLVVGKVFHAVFLFLVAALIALLLDPLVRALGKLRIPRGLSIAIVYLSFAAALAVVFVALGVIVVDQTQSAANRIDDYLTTESGQPPQTGFEQDVDRFQFWLDTHHLERIDIRQQGQDLAEGIQGMVQHMRKEQQMVRDWMEAQSTQQQALHETLKRLANASERNVTPLKRVGEGDDDWRTAAIAHGGAWYARLGTVASVPPAPPEAWCAYPGHYRSHNPWIPCFDVVWRREPQPQPEPTEPEREPVLI